jgi:outer membrane autotransporter protein
MKRIITSLAFCALFCLVTSSFAQTFIPKGSIVGGGGLSFSTGTSKSDSGPSTSKDTHTDLSLNPMINYYVIDNLGIGFSLGLTSSKSKDKDNNSEDSFTSITFGPLVRYYFSEGPFVQGSFGFGSLKSKYKSDGSTFDSKATISQWESGLGYSVRITDTILLDPMVGYGVSTIKNKDSDFTSSSSGLFLRLGFTMVLVSK